MIFSQTDTMEYLFGSQLTDAYLKGISEEEKKISDNILCKFIFVL